MSQSEAQRCLLCKKPFCSQACPVHTDVPTCMRLYREGRIEEAAQILFANNPLSAITSQVCDWQHLCYGHCILNRKGIPVRWYEIEQEISMPYLLRAHITPGADNGRSVAIVGGGPVGITAAIKLREKGYAVTVFDDNARLGGVLRYGIPRFRLGEQFINAYERIFEEAGIRFQGNTCIGKDLSLAELRQRFDAVCIGGGAWSPRRMRIPGEDNPKVIYALEYLKNPDAFQLGRKVIVIGGGNVTMDASRTAVRRGHDTWVYYRKTFGNMPANSIEVRAAQADGVKFELFQVPVEVKQDTLVIRRCENVTADDGSVITRMIDGTDFEVPFDNMIVAISENVDYSLFGDTMPELDKRGRIFVDSLQQTSLPGVFLAGDFLTGPETVVAAVASAKTAVEGITLTHNQ